MLLAMGCVTHRGPWRLDPGTAPAETGANDGVDLVLLANLAPNNEGARAVAARVEQVLAEDRPHAVLWLGNSTAAPLRTATPAAERRGPRCRTPKQAWTSPAGAALAGAVTRPDPLPRFAVHGVLDHRCGHGPAVRDQAPWHTPGSHFVLRVHTDGSVTTRLACSDGGCTRVAAPAPATESEPLVDLVMIDLAPWLHPSRDPVARRRDELQVQALEVLLTLTGQGPPHGSPPRLLVTNAPVEAGGEHGLGALWPDATFRGLPPRLQSALVEGTFAGVLAGYDRSLQATADVSDAIKRADRAWLRAPVFQVVAGAVTAPNRRAGMALRPKRLRTSQAYAPPRWSDHPGFAVVRLRGDRAELILHARRRRHWETTSLTVPLRPAPHPARTASPPMVPCRDCPPIPASER
jgi:hypothetical protein